MRISDWSSDVCSSDLAALEEITFLHGDVLALGHQIFDRLDRGIFWTQDNAALGLVILSEFDPAGNTSDDRVVLGLARLEQLGHPWQTTGDVAGLGSFARNTHQHVTGLNSLHSVDHQNRIEHG